VKKIAGPDGSDASVFIHQDANIYATKLATGEQLDFTVQRGRHAWLQVARGALTVNGTLLRSGDAVASSKATQLHIVAHESTDALLFDLA
jgi:quercetin 2,3-dioxygenase